MNSLDEDDEDCEPYEPTFKDAKEEFGFGWSIMRVAEMEDYHLNGSTKKAANLMFLLT